MNAMGDGWIKWFGGECPLTEDQKFDAKWEDGSTSDDLSAWEWRFYMDEGDGDNVPIAYRIRRALTEDTSNG